MSTHSITGTLMVLGAYMSAAVEPPDNVAGDLHSPLNLTTSFDPHNVKEVSWKYENNGTEKQIVTIKNGNIADGHNGYGQFNNGLVLEISNLTEEYLGLYTADVTFLNNTMKMKSFNVTIREQRKKPNQRNSNRNQEIQPCHTDHKNTTYRNLLGIVSMVILAFVFGLPFIYLRFCN